MIYAQGFRWQAMVAQMWAEAPLRAFQSCTDGPLLAKNKIEKHEGPHCAALRDTRCHRKLSDYVRAFVRVCVRVCVCGRVRF